MFIYRDIENLDKNIMCSEFNLFQIGKSKILKQNVFPSLSRFPVILIWMDSMHTTSE